MRTALIIIGSLVGFFILIAIIGGGFDESGEKYKKRWSEMSYAEKSSFLKDVKNKDIRDAYGFINAAEYAAKQEFKYPKEVEFEGGGIDMDKMRIRNIESGEVIFKGDATGKNAYGVKSELEYYVIMKLRPNDDNLELVEAGLNE